MTVAVVVLAGVLAAAFGLVAWLTHGRVTDADQVADARVAQVATEGELERAQFELEQTKQALVSAERRCMALEELLDDQSDTNADLPADDWRTRVLRYARRAAGDRADGVSASGEATVPPQATSAASRDDLLDPGGPDV